jgi:hypothetical protein
VIWVIGTFNAVIVCCICLFCKSTNVYTISLKALDVQVKAPTTHFFQQWASLLINNSPVVQLCFFKEGVLMHTMGTAKF